MQKLSTESSKFQLHLTLYDLTFRRFFGRTWQGQAQPFKSQMVGTPRQVIWDEVVCFHTTLTHPAIVLVLEVVQLPANNADGEQPVSCGWGIIRLFHASPSSADVSSQTQRMTLFHGSPRSLVHPALEGPIETNKLLQSIEGCSVTFRLSRYQALENAFHLLPENCLVSAHDSIPGFARPLTDPRKPPGDTLLRPRLVRCSPCVLSDISISLLPTLEAFEEELLELLNKDRLSQV
uniref:Uncharacterized protein n=1 Tax=Eptatretus burgeri TaxID=7764 RepID=A0A8C4QNP7_EPTBU